jgi:hypothetical protein
LSPNTIRREAAVTLADVFSALSTSGSLAVAGSFAYLAIQTRQNTKNTRALIHQGDAARITAIRIGMMDADRSAAWFEGNTGRSPTPEEVRKLQFHLACATALDTLEEHYLQHQAGLQSNEQFARYAAFFAGLLQEPGMRAFWQDQRSSTACASRRFSAFVDSLCQGEATEFGYRV